MFDPGPCVYMEKMAGGEEIADLLDLDRPLPETLKLIAERKGEAIGDVIVVMLDRPRHEEAMKRSPRGRRPHPPDHRRRRLRRAAGGERTLAGRPAVGDRRHPGGRDLGRRPEVDGRAADRPPLAAQRRGALGGDRRRLRPRPRPHRRRPLLRRRRLLLRHRRHRRRRPPGRPLPRPRRHHRVAGDALALGHRAPRRTPATTARKLRERSSASATADLLFAPRG